MKIRQFKIVKSGPYMDNKNWQAYCADDSGRRFKARGMTAMQALHALFLEMDDNDEAGDISEVDGQKSLPAGDGGGLPNCS